MHVTPFAVGSQESKCNSASLANISGRISKQNLDLMKNIWQNNNWKFVGLRQIEICCFSPSSVRNLQFENITHT